MPFMDNAIDSSTPSFKIAAMFRLAFAYNDSARLAPEPTNRCCLRNWDSHASRLGGKVVGFGADLFGQIGVRGLNRMKGGDELAIFPLSSQRF